MARGSMVAIGVFAVVIGIAVGFFAFSGNMIDTDDSMTSDVTVPAVSPVMQDVNIGHITPLVGDLSQYGQDGLASVNVAIGDFNEYLGELDVSWRLDVVHEDSQSNPVIALEKLTALKARGIDVIIGPYASSDVTALKGYSDSNNMIMISPSSTAPQLAIPDDSIFRLVSDDTKQSKAIARLVRDAGIETLVVLQRGDAWGDGLYAATQEAFVAAGGTSIDLIRYNPDTPEFAVSLSLLADKVSEYADAGGASSVGVLTISFAETLEIFQEAANYDILTDVMWFCSDGIVTNQNIIEDSIALEFATATSLQGVQASVPQNPTRISVEQRLTEELGRVPNTYSYGAYDSVWIVGTAILETGGNDPVELREAIPRVAERHSGALGSTMLNDAGDLDSTDYTVWSVIDGDWDAAATYVASDDQIILS